MFIQETLQMTEEYRVALFQMNNIENQHTRHSQEVR